MRSISVFKSETAWMLELQLKGLRGFGGKLMSTWGSDLNGVDFDNIKYFVRSTEKQATSWDDRLGVPEEERQRLVSGVAAQYESEVVYHAIREGLEQ